MLIRVVNPKGLAPSVNPVVLAESMAQQAEDCLLGMGTIKPLRETTNVVTPSKVGTIKSIFPYGGKWFNWLEDVSVCLSPIAQDAWDRVYFAAGDDFVPQMTVAGIATGGPDYPTVSYNLGVPVPGSLPTTTVVGSITDPDTTLVESRSYVMTYVSAYGEEGPPCAATDLVNVAPGQTVDLSVMPTGPAGAYNITQKRIYRTNTGSSGTDFQLVATVAVALTDYNDSSANDELGSVLPSTTWDAPPDDLHSIIMLPCGALAGLSGNELCFSVPYMPHAWPTDYRVSFAFDGVSLGAYGNAILIATAGMTYVVIGSHPSNMTPPERMEEGYACVSGRGVVDMGYSIIYPAKNGLMLVSMGEVRLLTEGLIEQDDWTALAPETIHAYLWNGLYVAFWTNGTGTQGFIFNPKTGDLSYHDIAATAGYHDPLTGVLYLVSAGEIVSWHSGANRTATWKSKHFKLPYSTNMSCAAVIADSYPVTVKIYADGVLKKTKAVADARAFRLPSGFLANGYEIEIQSAFEVQQVAIASSMRELGSV